MSEVDQLVQHGHARVQPALLGQVAPGPARQCGDRGSVPAHLAGVRAQDPQADPHRRGLAGAVRAQEAEDLSPRHVEGQRVQGQRRREALRDAIDLEAHRRRIAGARVGRPRVQVSMRATMAGTGRPDHGPSVRARRTGATRGACHNGHVISPASIHADRAAGTLQLEWPDGHRTTLRDRRSAGCAHARSAGARQDPGWLDSAPTLSAEQTRLVDVRSSATHALCPSWGDGHHTGYYTFDLLRHHCPVPSARPMSEGVRMIVVTTPYLSGHRVVNRRAWSSGWWSAAGA